MSAPAVLDRVAVKIEEAQSELELALGHFGQGQLFQSQLALRQARDKINKSLATIRTRGRS